MDQGEDAVLRVRQGVEALVAVAVELQQRMHFAETVATAQLVFVQQDPPVADLRLLAHLYEALDHSWECCPMKTWDSDSDVLYCPFRGLDSGMESPGYDCGSGCDALNLSLRDGAVRLGGGLRWTLESQQVVCGREEEPWQATSKTSQPSVLGRL
jgi:hypothetical protein